MARRNEDYDEFCDPDNPRLIKHEEVLDAQLAISEYIKPTPLMPSHSQKKFSIILHYKLEIMQKTGSFKDRGAVNALLKLPLDKKKLGIVVASLGNEGIAMSYHGNKLNIPVIVVMPNSVPISQMQKCRDHGAKVVVQGFNLAEAQRYARAVARDKGLTYINGRDHPDILAGYATIALEILTDCPGVDAIIVPVGTGGLAGAVAAIVKQKKPSCLVYGVQPESTPNLFKYLEAEDNDQLIIVHQPTIADNTVVSTVGVNGIANAQPHLDKMLLVKEDWIARAMLYMFERQKFVVEGAGACPLAAIIGNLVPEFKLKTVVAIISGGNVNNMVFSRALERGLAAEGRLVKFKVGIKDTSAAQTQLLQLLANGGYQLVHHFQHHRWLTDDEYFLEMSLVYKCKNLEHALELKRIIERAYPCNAVFETEPFNDKRTCPCYVYKNICAY